MYHTDWTPLLSTKPPCSVVPAQAPLFWQGLITLCSAELISLKLSLKAVALIKKSVGDIRHWLVGTNRLAFHALITDLLVITVWLEKINLLEYTPNMLYHMVIKYNRFSIKLNKNNINIIQLIMILIIILITNPKVWITWVNKWHRTIFASDHLETFFLFIMFRMVGEGG